MRVPGLILSDDRLMAEIREDASLEQVANVACLPGIVGASLAMPDIHWGYGFPIGGVAAFDPDAGGVISPGRRRLRHQLRRAAPAHAAHRRGRSSTAARARRWTACTPPCPPAWGARGRIALKPARAATRWPSGGAAWAVGAGLGRRDDLERHRGARLPGRGPMPTPCRTTRASADAASSARSAPATTSSRSRRWTRSTTRGRGRARARSPAGSR